MRSLPLKLLVLATSCLCAASCVYDTPELPQAWGYSDPHTPDSLSFVSTHHYWIGYNFQALDSLVLQTAAPNKESADYATLPQEKVCIAPGERLAVAQIVCLPGEKSDSLYLKVASDGQRQGWMLEKELLSKVVPTDPISKAIRFFSQKGLPLAGACLVVALILRLLLSRGTIIRPPLPLLPTASFYPALLLLCVATSATLYGSIRAWRPEDWAEFYFHPSLNPLDPELSPLMGCFLGSCWAVVLAALAAADDLRARLWGARAVAVGISLLGGCIALHLVFRLATPSRLSFFLLPLLFIFVLWVHAWGKKRVLLCGACSKEIFREPKKRAKKTEGPQSESSLEAPQEGLLCPHCGALNQTTPPLSSPSPFQKETP